MGHLSNHLGGKHSTRKISLSFSSTSLPACFWMCCSSRWTAGCAKLGKFFSALLLGGCLLCFPFTATLRRDHSAWAVKISSCDWGPSVGLMSFPSPNGLAWWGKVYPDPPRHRGPLGRGGADTRLWRGSAVKFSRRSSPTFFFLPCLSRVFFALATSATELCPSILVGRIV